MKLVSSVCSREMTACFLSVSGANCLPARCLLRGLTRWNSLGSILPTGLVTGCSTMAGRLLTSFPTFPMLCTEVSISLDPIWRAGMANGLQQMLIQSQLSQPGYWHLALISCMLGYNTRHHDGAYLNVKVTSAGVNFICGWCYIQQ